MSEEESATFEETVKVLDDYFVLKANVPFEKHLFRQISQASDETVDQFVCKLRQQPASYDFGEFEDDYIRDQLIDKCYSSNLRRKFLAQEGTLTLDCLLKVARAQEAASRQLKEMEANSGHVDAVGGKMLMVLGARNGVLRGTRKLRGTWVTRETRLAGKMARNQRSVMDAAVKDVLQGIRNAQPAIRLAGSVAELDIFNFNVVMEKTTTARKPVLVEEGFVVKVFEIGTPKQILSKTSDC